jgi:hypothetical protein
MATTYEFRVGGHLDAHWTGLLGGLAVEHLPDGTSALTGPMVDQAQLHGVLVALRDIGATLMSLKALPDDEPKAPPGDDI